MRATIKDIAKMVGLSPASVSLVLNNKPCKISEASRERIKAAAKELHYRPNQIAQNLKSRQSNSIGLIVANIRNDFYSSFAKGVDESCRKNGKVLTICNSNFDELECLEIMYSRGVDGVIICLASTNGVEQIKLAVDSVEENGIPYFLLDKTVEREHSNFVLTDHKLGGYLATKHLIDNGHKKIACITGPSHIEGSKSRLRGYKKALEEAGITFDESIVIPGAYLYEDGYDNAQKITQMKDVTAIFTFNDMQAFGLYNRLKELGKSIPDDYSIVGYDDHLYASLTSPPLTTVNQPIYDMGVSVGEAISNLHVDGERVVPPIIFEPKLVIRDSVRKIDK